MDINPDVNYQKSNIDLSQLNLPKNLQENKTATGAAGSELSADTAPGASSVNLSEEGRAASFKFDFNAETENLSKLEALGNSKSFGNAHASISYDKVKHLLD